MCNWFLHRSSAVPPAVTYEEVDVSGQTEHNIELQSNEAYGPVQNRIIVIKQNQAYGQVQLWINIISCMHTGCGIIFEI